MLNILLTLRYWFLPESSSEYRHLSGPVRGCTEWGLTSGLYAMLTSFRLLVYRSSDFATVTYHYVVVSNDLRFVATRASWWQRLGRILRAQHLASTVFGVFQNL